MRRSLIAICYALPVTVFAQFPPAQAQQPAQAQIQQPQQTPSGGGFVGGWRRPGAQAQPANPAAASQPTITFPQRQQQAPAAPPVLPPVSIQREVPLYNQAPAIPATPAATAVPTRSSGSSSSASSSSAKKDSGSSSASKPSTQAKSTPKPAVKSSSASDASKKSEDTEKTTTLEKLVKKVDGNDKKEEPKKAVEEKKAAEPTPTPAPKKTKEEIEYEKAQEEMARSADQARQAVADFLKNANDGAYSKATEALTPEIQKYFESDLSAINGSMKTVIDGVTHNGTLKMVTYTNTTVRGEGARVDAEFGFEDGSKEVRNFDLIKIKNQWKIVLSVSGQSETSAPAPAAATPAAPEPTPVAAMPNSATLATETTAPAQ